MTVANTIDAELRSTATLLEQMSISDDLERGDFRNFYLSAERAAEQLGWREIAVSDSEGRVLLRSSVPFGQADSTTKELSSMTRVIALQVVA